MKRLNLADAKAQFSELVERAGEAVCITRRGKAVAQIVAVDTPRKRVDLAALKAVTDACLFSRRAPAVLSGGCAVKTGIDAVR